MAGTQYLNGATAQGFNIASFPQGQNIWGFDTPRMTRAREFAAATNIQPYSSCPDPAHAPGYDRWLLGSLDKAEKQRRSNIEQGHHPDKGLGHQVRRFFKTSGAAVNVSHTQYAPISQLGALHAPIAPQTFLQQSPLPATQYTAQFGALQAPIAPHTVLQQPPLPATQHMAQPGALQALFPPQTAVQQPQQPIYQPAVPQSHDLVVVQPQPQPLNTIVPPRVAQLPTPESSVGEELSDADYIKLFNDFTNNSDDY